MGASIPYAPIHCSSYFSLCQGVLSPEEICQYARRRGYPAVGMADVNNLYGLPRFLKAAGREGVKPVVGAILARGEERLGTAFVLDPRGFNRLCAILTQADIDGRDPLRNLLEEGWEGLALLVEDPVLMERLAARQREGLYARLTYGRPFGGLIRYARAAGLPLCAVNELWMLEEDDAAIQRVLRAIGGNCRLEDLAGSGGRAPVLRTDLRPGQGSDLRPGQAVGAAAMERFFSAAPQALANAFHLAEEAGGVDLLPRGCVFPCFDGQSEEESFRMLRRRCLAGIERRYGSPGPGTAVAAARSRLDCELAVIRDKGFAGYFLVVHDIVSRCPRTCGRGSSAASIVSYLLGITHVDPLRYNLFFERFLNRERNDPPDIDVDFPWDERERALRYVFERYPDRAGMVADHVTFAGRACLREPARVLGHSQEEIRRLVRAYRYGEQERIPAELLRAGGRIRGFPRHLGTHPGGVVITPEPITRYTHLRRSPLGYPVIAWEKEGAEEAGLVKIDLLGNRSLGVLRDALQLVNPRRVDKLTWEGFDPLEDRETRELIAAGRTLGVFYVESPATRQLLRKMRAGDFENLVIASSIIRPAANRYIREFVKRLHGAPYNPLHPRLEETLRETRGIMVYQEDVSRVAMDLVGLSAGEADQLRKVLTKRDRARRLPDFRERFLKRGREQGIDCQTLERVWDMILSFDGYSFCKAHSASYAQVSYRLAYLKRFHPLEFFAAVINNGGGFYSRQTYLDECRRLGYRILGPDVNASAAAYTVEYRAGAALRVGLSQLREVSASLVERVLEEREQRGPYADLGDFLSRLSAGKPPRPPGLRSDHRPGLLTMRLLIRSGALDSISGGLTRPQALWSFFQAGQEPGFFLPPPPPSSIGDYPAFVKQRDEIATLGLSISRHPLRAFRQRLARAARVLRLPALIASDRLGEWVGRRVSLGGLMVTGKEVTTRAKEPMSFVSFEDEASIYETVLFPAAYRRYARSIDGGAVFLLAGKVEDEQGALSVHVDRLLRLKGLSAGAPAGAPPRRCPPSLTAAGGGG